MAGKSKYIVFGVGMLALVVGLSVSLWMLLARPGPGPGEAGAPAAGGTPSLSQALQQSLGLTEEQADNLARQLQEAGGPAPAAPPGVSGPGGPQERSSIGDSVEFEVRDASGKLKQRGSGR
ncbi:MAG: hypothetical protein HY686_08760 [Chloroflexi bacterium]|nr:hypothetical protein [Chloroflexota bacterium]